MKIPFYRFSQQIFGIIFVFNLTQNINASNSFRSLFKPDKILNGKQVLPGELPYQVSIELFGELNCGGAILDENTVITAAHCLAEIVEFPSSTTIRAGTIYPKDDGIVKKVSKLLIHENYLADNADDIGLIFVDSPLNFSNLIKPIKVATKCPKGDDTVLVAGWGVVDLPTKKTAQTLLKIQLPVVDIHACQQKMEEAANKYSVDDVKVDSVKHLCAGVHEGGTDACQGDSGGGLVYENTLVGLVSFGISCGLPNVPGVYTNVIHQRQWLKKNWPGYEAAKKMKYD